MRSEWLLHTLASNFSYVILWASGRSMMPTSTCGFVLILLLLCLFGIGWMQVGEVSLGEDEEILQQLLVFIPHGGSCVFLFN